MATEQGRIRLQQFLQEHRVVTGATWGDMGSSTVRQWTTDGVSPNPTPKVLLEVDELLGWKPGSAASVVSGGEPERVEPAGEMPAEVLEMLASVSLSLDEARRALDAIVDRHSQ